MLCKKIYMAFVSPKKKEKKRLQKDSRKQKLPEISIQSCLVYHLSRFISVPVLQWL